MNTKKTTPLHTPSRVGVIGLLLMLVLVLLAVPALAQKLDPALDPGDSQWRPEASTSGPVIVIASIPEQMLHVYRGGVRIGWATTTTGKPGHETPTGVYPILQKEREHYSNLYDNAPMPFMQRLTWGGVAIHGGRVHEEPASHGCLRLPKDFAEKLFEVTDLKDIVIVSGESHHTSLVRPGDTLPVDAIRNLGSDEIDDSDLVVNRPDADPATPAEKKQA